MINFNGDIVEGSNVLDYNNRGFAYGDSLFETIRYSYGKLLFWEDHYFRLMASMRILRMEIPMNFTMEFLEEQVLNTIAVHNLAQASVRVKLNVYRKEGGLYLPINNDIGFIISIKPLDNDFYLLSEDTYEVDLFKDYYVSPTLLSTLKTNNKVLHVIGSIYAKENKLNNCLILNTDKKVIEGLNGNIFLVKDKVIKTPPLGDGCLKGILRKQLMDIIKEMPEYELQESSISPFELQKADELFLTNVIFGIQPIFKYRKKVFDRLVAKELLKRLNSRIRLT